MKNKLTALLLSLSVMAMESQNDEAHVSINKLEEPCMKHVEMATELPEYMQDIIYFEERNV